MLIFHNEKVIGICLCVRGNVLHIDPHRALFLGWLLPNLPVMGVKEGGRWRAVERLTTPTGLCLPAGLAPWSEHRGAEPAVTASC